MGLSADEFKDNGNFPRQAYVREGRRMKGLYLFKAADALPLINGGRPPLHTSSITGSHYDIDSHATRKREKGKNVLDGFLSYPTMPYTVPFEVMVPPVISNLLAPVPASATHLGFATLRMEPCWMALGQAAGIAASTVILSGKPVQKVPVTTIQDELIRQGAVLIYYKDINPAHPSFKAVQKIGLKGWLPDWTVRPDEKVKRTELDEWQKLSGLKFPKHIQANQSTRSEAIQWLFSKAQ
ncbi:FAD-dependent oxidoreductase [Pseudobacter ginsenosidimutans]|uniref:FAD-dependent oxidoreductase n=1 Tax=Pseudobacter ginsenosidimutans TaxID=661488 RepID=UPI001CEF996B|nr:FAD-dependent oxidoreductase [Pseudobacter ginsenosidimutans]